MTQIGKSNRIPKTEKYNNQNRERSTFRGKAGTRVDIVPSMAMRSLGLRRRGGGLQRS